MATTEYSTLSYVEVRTTKPVQQHLDPFTSERLIFLTLVDKDFPANSPMLLEKKTMHNSLLAVMSNEDERRQWFDLTKEYSRVGIFLKNSDDSEGELIGEGGVAQLSLGAPDFYYMLKEESWGKGYATEFVKKFMEIWWKMPREETHIKIEDIYLDSRDKSMASVASVAERLCASVPIWNEGSNGVVRKTGFDNCGQFLKDEHVRNGWRYISP